MESCVHFYQSPEQSSRKQTQKIAELTMGISKAKHRAMHAYSPLEALSSPDVLKSWRAQVLTLTLIPSPLALVHTLSLTLVGSFRPFNR